MLFRSILAHFVLFWCIWDHLVALRNPVQNRPNWCKSSCHEVTSEFFAMNAPDPPQWTLHSCFEAFVQFWCIWDRLVDLQNSVQYEPNWCKCSCHEVASEFFATSAPNPPPLDPKLVFWCVPYSFVAFWTVWLTWKLGAKRTELEQNVVPRSRVGIFRNECTRSTPLDPKLMFWCVRTILVHLGQFG